MNIVEAKEKLHKDGYTWFELSEFDKDFYNALLPLKCNNEYDIKDNITLLRADIKHIIDPNPYKRLQDDFGTFENALKEKEEICNATKNDKNLFVSQIWHFVDVHALYRLCNIDDVKFEKYIKKMMMYFYDYQDSQEYAFFTNITYYGKDCELKNHSDGTGTGRICAMLIYLNEEYDENDGGLLILNNTEQVTPVFGRVAMIDLKSFDIPHMVTKVTGGIGRYAVLTFVRRKEDEFVNY